MAGVLGLQRLGQNLHRVVLAKAYCQSGCEITMPLRYRRFYDVSLSERILNTAFLLTIGIGYLFALVNLYYSHQSRDGSPGLSIEDIAIAYHGSHDQTRLEAAIKGIMEPNLGNFD